MRDAFHSENVYLRKGGRHSMAMCRVRVCTLGKRKRKRSMRLGATEKKQVTSRSRCDIACGRGNNGKGNTFPSRAQLITYLFIDVVVVVVAFPKKDKVICCIRDVRLFARDASTNY